MDRSLDVSWMENLYLELSSEDEKCRGMLNAHTYMCVRLSLHYICMYVFDKKIALCAMAVMKGKWKKYSLWVEKMSKNLKKASSWFKRQTWEEWDLTGWAQRALQLGGWWGGAAGWSFLLRSFCACPGVPWPKDRGNHLQCDDKGLSFPDPPGSPVPCPSSGLLPWGDPGGALRECGQGWLSWKGSPHLVQGVRAGCRHR